MRCGSRNGRATSCSCTRSAPGAADRSYGIHVAKLAGLPAPVVARAEEVLKTLESGEQGSALTRLAEDLPLFVVARAAPAPPAPSALETALGAVRPDELSPREALELIYKLKGLADGNERDLDQCAAAFVSGRSTA